MNKEASNDNKIARWASHNKNYIKTNYKRNRFEYFWKARCYIRLQSQTIRKLQRNWLTYPHESSKMLLKCTFKKGNEVLSPALSRLPVWTTLPMRHKISHTTVAWGGNFVQKKKTTNYSQQFLQTWRPISVMNYEISLSTWKIMSMTAIRINGTLKW